MTERNKGKKIYKNELELVVLQSRQNKNIHHRSTKTTKTILIDHNIFLYSFANSRIPKIFLLTASKSSCSCVIS